MPVGETDPSALGPTIETDTSWSAEQILAVESLQRILETSPHLIQQSFDIYFENPEATSRMLEFLRSHPEGGLNVLTIAKKIVDEKLDLDMVFDDQTEAEINNDGVYGVAVKKFQETSDEANRTWFRRRRLKILANRATAA